MGELTVLRDGAPPLNNAPERLRWLADQLEASGDAAVVAVAVETHSDQVRAYGFGEAVTTSAAAGLFLRAAVARVDR